MKPIVLLLLLVAGAPAVSAAESGITQTLALTTIGFVDLVFLLCLALVAVALRRDPAWSLARALAETITWAAPKAAATPALGAAGLQAAGQKDAAPESDEPRVESSSSRLIAFVGMLAVVTVFVGMSNCVLWHCFLPDTHDPDTGVLLKFLCGGASLFVPYAVNQFRSAFESFGAPAKK